MSLPTYEELLKRNRELLSEQKAKALSDSDNIYDTQVNDVTGTYNKAIDEAKTSYEDEYEKNAVQRIINEKRIAEKNAALGLSNSGLNLTQQTAAELSYANRKGKIDTARQKSVDSLASKLAEAVSTIQINKASARGSIEQSYEKLAADNAASEYKANVDAETELQKALINAQTQLRKAAYSSSRSSSRSGSGGSNKATGLITVNGGKISRDFSGTLQENGISVMDNGDDTITYFDENTGKKTTLNSKINPFTKTKNDDTDYGTFKNTPYQPNNIGGRKLVQSTRNNKDGDWYNYNGQSQRIWTIPGTNQYFLWDGSTNQYITFSY